MRLRCLHGVKSASVVVGLMLLTGCTSGGTPSPSPHPSQRPPPTSSSSTQAPTPTLVGSIAFLSGNASGQRIYVMNADGTGAQRITDEPMSSSKLSWAPDGTQIAFDRGTGEGQGEIDLVDVSKGKVATLTTKGDPQSPSWSPLGSAIAFNTGTGVVDSIHADGRGFETLGCPPGTDPAWSPDGRFLVYAATGKGIAITNAHGDAFQTSVIARDARFVQPAWSPVGSQVAFSDGKDIYVVDVKKKASADLVPFEGGRPTDLTSGPGDDYQPTWSPDGSQIAFGSNRDGNQEIYVMNADGSEQTRLTDDPAIDDAPAWQPSLGPQGP